MDEPGEKEGAPSFFFVEPAQGVAHEAQKRRDKEGLAEGHGAEINEAREKTEEHSLADIGHLILIFIRKALEKETPEEELFGQARRHDGVDENGRQSPCSQLLQARPARKDAAGKGEDQSIDEGVDQSPQEKELSQPLSPGLFQSQPLEKSLLALFSFGLKPPQKRNQGEEDQLDESLQQDPLEQFKFHIISPLLEYICFPNLTYFNTEEGLLPPASGRLKCVL